MWAFQLSTKYVIRTIGQMLLGHHPYALSGPVSCLSHGS